MPEHSLPAIVEKSWRELTTDELYAILRLRTDVFFVEQRVDESELDGRDREPSTQHLWIPDGVGGVAAYLRVIHDEQAEYRDAFLLPGRVVVAAEFRRRGLARRLMERVTDRFGSQALLVHAQSYVAEFYAGFGFAPVGEEFIEAGILHRAMYRPASA